jgi:phosphoribosylformylglycinamidine cyclo-ligase
MGIGFTVIVDEHDKTQTLEILKQQNVNAYEIGRIVEDSHLNVLVEHVVRCFQSYFQNLMQRLLL